MNDGWIAVDLDGTLAHYTGSVMEIGAPVPLMAARVQMWLAEGREVRIFTARVGATGHHVEISQMTDDERFAVMQREMIEQWTEEHFGIRLPVTATKDYAMLELWDDRAVRVEMNTGRIL